MASATSLILLGCVLCIGTFVKGDSTTPAYYMESTNLDLDNKTFGTSRWIGASTTQMDQEQPTRDIIQNQSRFRKMEKLVRSAKENGLKCFVEENRLTCANVDRHQRMVRLGTRALKKYWKQNMSKFNIGFMILNLGILIFVLIWKCIRTIRESRTMLPVWLSESTENT